MGIVDRLSRLMRAEWSHRAGVRAPASVAQAGGARPSPPPVREPAVPPHIAQAYRVLVVEPGADRETTREAWIDLLQRYHPDHHQGEDAARMERVREKTLEVQAAWEILDDWLPNQ
jgi:DnaJ-domain-containing protein 1